MAVSRRRLSALSSTTAIVGLDIRWAVSRRSTYPAAPSHASEWTQLIRLSKLAVAARDAEEGLAPHARRQRGVGAHLVAHNEQIAHARRQLALDVGALLVIGIELS